MEDEHCRITIVGDRRQVDLAVPAGAPITDYVDDLARLCAMEENDIMPPAWSLATGLGAAFAPERSLAELGVVDGQVLYLRDILADELQEPVVLDVAEQVAQASGQFLDRSWDATARAATVLGCGIAWIVLAVIALATVRPGPGTQAVSLPTVSAVALFTGVALPLLAWTARERRWSLPVALRILLALTSVPLLAVAAAGLAATRWQSFATGAHPLMSDTGLIAAATAAGTLLGGILAYAAASGVATFAVLAATGTAFVTAGGLALLRADGAQSAAVVAVVAFLLLMAAPTTAGRIVASAFRRSPAGDGHAGTHEAEQVRAAVRTAMVLLAAWGVLLSLVLAGSLARLGSSGSGYASAIAGCLGVALLLRAGSAKVVVEVVPGAVAGATGLFVLLLTGPAHLGAPGWTAPVALVLVAAVLLGYGFRRLLRRDLRQLARPGWFGTLGTAVGALSIPLLLAALGVFGTLTGMGKHL